MVDFQEAPDLKKLAEWDLWKTLRSSDSQHWDLDMLERKIRRNLLTHSVNSVAVVQSFSQCPALCNPTDCSPPGFPVLHYPALCSPTDCSPPGFPVLHYLPLQSYWLQPAGLPCPSLSPRVCPDSVARSQWCYLTVSSSATRFPSCPRSCPQVTLCWDQIGQNPPTGRWISQLAGL